MSEPVRRSRVAIIGCGSIAQSHLRYLGSSSSVEVVAIADPAVTVSKHIAAMLGPQVKVFSSHSDMLSNSSPEVVHILTPPASHGVLVADSLRAGANVICEKPVAGTGRELLPLLALAEQNHRFLFECQNYRFLPEMTWLLGLIKNDAFGEIRSVEVHARVPIASGAKYADEDSPHQLSHLPGGAIRDFLPHMAYVARSLLDFDSMNVVGVDWRLVSGRKHLGFDRLLATLADEKASLRLEFHATGAPPAFAVSVVGDEGSASVDLFHNKRSVERRDFGGPLAAIFDRLRNSSRAIGDSRRELIARTTSAGGNGIPEFLDSIYPRLAAGESLSSGEQHLSAEVELVDKLIEKGGLR